ncbi:hypothetical protein LIER_42486 [Lithospermum erythrorhizon]|uniref:Uncharacterized protein n=1 Tax=Lithospermum erythrorhizon TaxID=34254 RepID=A0AAV3RU06_LITER
MEIEKLIQQGHLREFTREMGHKRPHGRGSSPPRYLPHRRKNSPPRHNPYRNVRKKYARREVYRVVNMQVGTEAITFTDADCQGLEMPHDGPFVIAPKIAHYTAEKMLVDTGSSTDIIYFSAFYKLNLPRSIIEPMRTPLTGFTGHSVYPLGVARLWVTMGKGLTSTTFQA